MQNGKQIPLSGNQNPIFVDIGHEIERQRNRIPKHLMPSKTQKINFMIEDVMKYYFTKSQVVINTF